MGNGARFALFTSGAVVFLMLLRDGSLTTLISDAATGARDFATGVKPVTRIA